MHADDRRRLNGIGALYLLQVDHRNARVGVALGARLNAGVATDASAWVYVELPLTHNDNGCTPDQPRTMISVIENALMATLNLPYGLKQFVEFLHEDMPRLAFNPLLLLPTAHDADRGLHGRTSEFSDFLPRERDIQQKSLWDLTPKRPREHEKHGCDALLNCPY